MPIPSLPLPHTHNCSWLVSSLLEKIYSLEIIQEIKHQLCSHENNRAIQRLALLQTLLVISTPTPSLGIVPKNYRDKNLPSTRDFIVQFHTPRYWSHFLSIYWSLRIKSWVQWNKWAFRHWCMATRSGDFNRQLIHSTSWTFWSLTVANMNWPLCSTL